MQLHKHPLTWLIGVCLTSTMNTTIEAADPPGQAYAYNYNIYKNPYNPTSSLAIVLTFDLKERDRVGNAIGWEIREILFRRPGNGHNPDTVWGISLPDFESADGYWWVSHVDPDSPQLSEFDMPPLLEGVAIPEDLNDDDLEYSFEGVAYTPPPEGPLFDITFASDHSFALAGAPRAFKEGEDEPGEIDPPENDPPIST